MRAAWPLLLLGACDWVFEPTKIERGDDTAGGGATDCSGLASATSSSTFISLLDLSGNALSVSAADGSACVSDDGTEAIFPFTVDGGASGSIHIQAPAGLYAWPGSPAPLLSVTVTGSPNDTGAAANGGSFSSWATGNMQVSIDGDTTTINLSNVNSASSSPSMSVIANLSVTR